jgi:hypothetical protein
LETTNALALGQLVDAGQSVRRTKRFAKVSLKYSIVPSGRDSLGGRNTGVVHLVKPHSQDLAEAREQAERPVVVKLGPDRYRVARPRYVQPGGHAGSVAVLDDLDPAWRGPGSIWLSARRNRA